LLARLSVRDGAWEDGTEDAESSSSRSHTTAAEFLQRVTAIQDEGPSASLGLNTSGPNTHPEYEQYYGVDIETHGQVDALQRLAEINGVAQVRRLTGEGIPIDAMGTPSVMQAYRERKVTRFHGTPNDTTTVQTTQ